MCSMCGEAVATENYGLPVCAPCHRMLDGLQSDLEELEAADPELKATGERVEQAIRKHLEERDSSL